MRHRPALDLLLRTFVESDDDDDLLHEALQDAIPQIAGVDAVAPLEARIPAQSWSFTLTAAEILSRIKHPDAEAALLRLLDHPKLAESRDRLADALFSLCTTDALPRLRQIVIDGAYDAQSYDLKGDLVACALMAGFDFPELPALREEVVAKEVETQRRLEAGEFDLSDFDDMDDDLTEEDFEDDPDDLPDLPASLDDRAPRHTAPIHNDNPKVGRNDPCPCGSGKKYKKCCIDKQADA
jgi:HEAT repeat protein